MDTPRRRYKRRTAEIDPLTSLPLRLYYILMNNKFMNRKRSFFHKLLGLIRGYATINYSCPRSRLSRIEMEQKIKNRDILFLFTGSLILVGLFKSAGEIYRRSIPQVIKAVNPVIEVRSQEPKTEIKYIEVVNDERVKKLEKFLRSKKSPLADYAGLIVKEADEHAISWVQLAAMSGKESSFGIHYPQGSHNAWGIKTCKVNDCKMRYFASWQEGIEFTSALIGNNYRWNMNSGIQKKYCPTAECSREWANDVTKFSNDIISTKTN